MPAATKERSAHDRSTVSEIFSVQHNCFSARNKSTDSTASPQTRLPRQASCMRAVLGIEPRTSRTLSENHTTRPNSRCSAPDVNTKALSEVVIQATHRLSSNAGRLGHGGPCAQGRMSHPPTVANSLLASSRLCKCVVRGPLVSPMADARKRYCRTFGGCCSLRGSNPRPLAHKTSALTTELRERLLTFEIKRKTLTVLLQDIAAAPWQVMRRQPHHVTPLAPAMPRSLLHPHRPPQTPQRHGKHTILRTDVGSATQSHARIPHA